MLNANEYKRYIRQLIVDDIGLDGQLKLKNTRILVVGAGGLGCPVLQYLNAAGIGTLGIIEHDVVELSNLHRQTVYTQANVGQPKAECIQQFLHAQNPNTRLIVHNRQLTAANAQGIITEFDFVVDGTDNFETRYLVNRTACALGKPVVYGSILGYQAQLAVFNLPLPNGTHSKNLLHIFPTAPHSRQAPSCAENGVLATVPGIAGTIMAQLALDVALQRSNMANIFMLLNTRTLQVTRLSY